MLRQPGVILPLRRGFLIVRPEQPEPAARLHQAGIFLGVGAVAPEQIGSQRADNRDPGILADGQPLHRHAGLTGEWSA